jgi:DNA-binding CsgD family transcriptional regulator
MHKKLDNNKQLFGHLEQILPGFFIVLDIHDFSIKYLSKKALKILNKTPEETTQMPVNEIKKYIFPNLTDKMYQEISRCIQNRFEEFGFYIKARYGEELEYQWFHAGFKPDYSNELVYAIIQPVTLNLNHISETISGFLDQCYVAMHENLDLNLLSTREKEILQLTSKGLSSEQIAEKLFISKNTVNNHRKKIIKKLGIKSLSEIRNLSSVY